MDEEKPVWAEITVMDQGVGIPKELVDRVFDPFFTTKAGGTGLGLAIVHRVIAEHRGVVRVERGAGGVPHRDPPRAAARGGARVSSRARVLVVDDERSMQEFLEIFLRSEGYDAVAVGDVAVGARAARARRLRPRDHRHPDAGRQRPRAAARGAAPHGGDAETVVIVMTAFASTETAIAAMKEGAYDYITKPFKVDAIRIIVEKAIEKKSLSSENRRLRSELRSRIRERHLIGTSRAMQRVVDLIAQVAATKANVLISGESGTGKEIAARAIHDGSERRESPFVAVNCGAIPENLLESELFGHVKGAFTGAVHEQAGPVRDRAARARCSSTRSASCRCRSR